MKRRLFNIAASVSLLLLLGTGWLWMRSHWVQDSFGLHRRGRVGATWEVVEHDVRSGRGVIGFGMERHIYLWEFNVTNFERDQGPRREIQWNTRTLGRDVNWGYPRWEKPYLTAMGFRGTGEKVRQPYLELDAAGFTVPIWPFAVVFAALPTRWLMRRERRWSWKHRGMCVACGYDLRASPDRCPECGAALLTVAQRFSRNIKP